MSLEQVRQRFIQAGGNYTAGVVLGMKGKGLHKLEKQADEAYMAYLKAKREGNK